MKDLRTQRRDLQAKIVQAERNLRFVGIGRSAETNAADPFYAGAKAMAEKEVARLEKRLSKVNAQIAEADARIASVLAKYSVQA